DGRLSWPPRSRMKRSGELLHRDLASDESVEGAPDHGLSSAAELVEASILFGAFEWHVGDVRDFPVPECRARGVGRRSRGARVDGLPGLVLKNRDGVAAQRLIGERLKDCPLLGGERSRIDEVVEQASSIAGAEMRRGGGH